MSSFIAKKLDAITSQALKLLIITNRGVKVWPDGMKEIFLTDHYRLRFKATHETINHNDIVSLLQEIENIGLDFIKMETLCSFDGKPGYSLAQGE